MKKRKVILFMLIVLSVIFYSILPDPLFTDSYSTVCYSEDGDLLGGRIAADGQWRFPPVDSLPQRYIDAVVLFEDERFFYHPGVDPFAIGRAIKQNLDAGKTVSGASTISMQTIRLSRRANKRNIKQKMVEAILALRLEFAYSKKEILCHYASHAPFGCNVVGIASASWRYFGKSVRNLTWAESSTLAVLPNAPSLMHPAKNRDALKAKRDRLLKRLWENGNMTETEYSLALMEDIPEAPRPLPHMAYHLVEEAKKLGIEWTTVQSPLQEMLYQTVQSYANEFNQTGINNIGAVISDTRSGQILAYIGNVSNSQNDGFVDMVQTKRSSGSILKPFLHAALIDDGTMAPEQLLEDTPISIAGFRPSNYHKQFDGAVAADEALQRSLNIPAVNNLQTFGITKFIHLLRKFKMTSITKSQDHYGLSLILGGAEVKLWDLVSAYSGMGRSLLQFTERNSRYSDFDYRPVTISKVESAKEKLLTKSEISAGAIWETFEAMRSLKRPNEEGAWQSFSSASNIAWKTGTSYGHRDAWAVGLNPEYTIGVWVGNSDGEGNNEIVGISTAGRVLFSVVNQLPKVSNWFDKPLDDMREMQFCVRSGHLASKHCESKEWKYVTQSVEKSKPCPYHDHIFLDKTGQYQVNSRCYELQDMNEKPWFSLPPEMAHFYKLTHSDYMEKPPFLNTCMEVNKNQLAILYPTANEKIFLPNALSGEKQRLVCEASHVRHKDKLFWHLNEEYLGVTEEFHTIELALNIGDYELMIMDIHGNMEKKKFSLVGE